MNIPKDYIRKYWFGVNEVEEISDVVLLMERDRIEQYKAALDITINHFKGVFKGITGIINGYRVSIIYSIGPAHIADCVNFLSYGFPLKRLFATGSIGGLNTAMGDIVISESCGTQDGYSMAIQPQKIEKNEQLGYFVKIQGQNSFNINNTTKTLIKERFNCEILDGTIFTIPCVSMEDRDTLIAIKRHGFIALDLETGPFLSACFHNKIRGTCIHWVTDLPIERDFYYPYHGNTELILEDKTKKHKQWLNMPKLILPILLDLLH